MDVSALSVSSCSILCMIALTHIPSPSMQSCVRTFVPEAAIDYALAAKQYADYCQALRDCRVQVITLDVNATHPDAVFIEDTAIVLDEIAVLCSLAPQSRRNEPVGIELTLRQHRQIDRIELPAIIEGGDVLRVGRTLLVGQSSRTSAAGIASLAGIVTHYGYEVRPVPVRGCLHLKTACTALPDGRLLLNPAWIDAAALADYEQIAVPDEEPWAANVALVRSSVLLHSAHAQTASMIDGLGFNVRPIDLSEFAKAEGGVTCLSLLIS
jgi:dimethylargininase